MTDLLLLGIVPGTRIEITFELWLFSLGITCFVMIAAHLIFDRKTFQHALFVLSVYASIWRAKRQVRLA